MDKLTKYNCIFSGQLCCNQLTPQNLFHLFICLLSYAIMLCKIPSKYHTSSILASLI